MKTKDYNTELSSRLIDLDEAGEYLTACYNDSREVFLLGLRQVVDAHGGVSTLSNETKLNRESLYRLLSEGGNPQLSSLSAILDTIGLGLEFKPIGKKGKRARA